MTDTETTQSKSTPNLPIPSLFGPYEITSHLGMGGMGDVYKARHLELDRVVAQLNRRHTARPVRATTTTSSLPAGYGRGPTQAAI